MPAHRNSRVLLLSFIMSLLCCWTPIAIEQRCSMMHYLVWYHMTL